MEGLILNRLEAAKKDFYEWKLDTDTTAVMYSKNAHECLAWILYEQVADMVDNNAANEEIAEFSRAFISFSNECIED